jgi:signal transduction histidine kinase
VRVIRDFQADSAWAVADGDKMKQVFWNLCENSLRALPEGGILTVMLEADRGNWLITFRDNGPGMTPQQLEKIFEPFQSRFEGGSGLGLAIVYQIVEAHGGTIRARSSPGEGAEFRLELARTEPAVASAAVQKRLSAKVAHG